MNRFHIAAILYLAAVNLAGFLSARSDKRRAARGAWRIRERTFILLSALGGGPGVLAGFLAFRHKTKHAALMLGVIAITSLLYGIIVYILI